MVQCKLNVKVNNFQHSNMVKEINLPKELDKIIDNLKSRVEREIPDTGYFRDFGVSLGKEPGTSLYGKDFSLFVQRDERRDGRAFLGLSLLHPVLQADASVYIMNGERGKILEYINNPEFKNEIMQKLSNLSETLKYQK